ncbi:hypothetical protein LX36DRAFT_153028 [Colletotrichum falcatum]|nr:hypothetical protein LX36DRAFT_153028 [Colletotrichum falcatum]
MTDKPTLGRERGPHCRRTLPSSGIPPSSWTPARPNLASFPALSHIPAPHPRCFCQSTCEQFRPTTQPPLLDFLSPRFPRENTAEEPPGWLTRPALTNHEKTIKISLLLDDQSPPPHTRDGTCCMGFP